MRQKRKYIEMKWTEEHNRGPAARHSDAHIFAALNIILENERISRKDLSDELGLGEGSTRNLLKTMNAWKQIIVQQKGIMLSRFGRETLETLPVRFVEISSPTYVQGEYQQAILVKGRADTITNGMKQRDLGIRYGSEGASVFIMKDGCIIFPPDVKVDERDPEFAKKIRAVGMSEGDVLIIVGSDSLPKSRISAAGIGLETI